VYRVGESDADLMGRGRVWMVVLPWVGMTGVSCAAYAFVAAREGLRDAHGWGADLLWPAVLWALSQAAVALPAGRLRESGRLSARAGMLTGAFATLAGCLALAFAPGLLLVCAVFGVVGGAGAGLVHATCLTLPGKWYPERRGAPTGWVASGLAVGAVPLLPVLGSASDRAGQRTLLAATGAGVCLVVAVAGWFFRDPPRNWWPPHLDPLAVPADPGARRLREKNPPAVRQYTLREAARHPALWLMWLCLLCAAAVTVLDLFLLAPFGRSLGLAHAAVSSAAVAGGAGLGAVGALSGRLGRRSTLIAACVLLGIAQFGILAAGGVGGVPLLLVCAVAVGLAGGAVLPLVIALTADYFGENHSASVYGLLACAWLLPVLVGSGTHAAAAGVRDPHGALLWAGCTGLACAVPALFLKAPGRPSARRIVPNPHPLGEEMA
jgi:MFS family permease